MSLKPGIEQMLFGRKSRNQKVLMNNAESFCKVQLYKCLRGFRDTNSLNPHVIV